MYYRKLLILNFYWKLRLVNTDKTEHSARSLSAYVPHIQSTLFGRQIKGLGNPPAESTKQCCRAYKKFVEDYPSYNIDVKLCAFAYDELEEAKKVFNAIFE